MARPGHPTCSNGHGGSRYPEATLHEILVRDHNRISLKQIARRKKKAARRVEVAQVRQQKPQSREEKRTLWSHLLHYLNIGR